MDKDDDDEYDDDEEYYDDDWDDDDDEEETNEEEEEEWLDDDEEDDDYYDMEYYDYPEEVCATHDDGCGRLSHLCSLSLSLLPKTPAIFLCNVFPWFACSVTLEIFRLPSISHRRRLHQQQRPRPPLRPPRPRPPRPPPRRSGPQQIHTSPTSLPKRSMTCTKLQSSDLRRSTVPRSPRYPFKQSQVPSPSFGDKRSMISLSLTKLVMLG